MNDVDVAVIGYGPTGMTLAALLGQAGHRVVVLERYAGLYNLPRAACFDDEIMRTFQKLGITEGIARGSVAQRDYDWVNAQGETLVRLEYADRAPAGWAALYMMFQPEIESVLDRLDRSLPSVEIRQGVTVTGFDQDAESVTFRGVGTDGEAVTVRARYAVGADGGNGFARRAIGGDVDDYGFQENWLVCDFHMKRVVPTMPVFRQICDPVQPTSIVRIGPEHHRFSFMLGPGVTAEEATAEDGVWSRVSRYITRDDAELIRAANYVFRSRVAQTWRKGRVLLAGDAAHEMPPFLGQGMCSGMRDSHNLAWKLDLVLTGRADDALLDTYQAEREPHVRFITEKAIELGRVQTLRDPEAARVRDERMLAQRRADRAPDKVRLPGLSGGLVANDGGFFPQGRVRSDGHEGLFDDVTGSGWRLVTLEPEIAEALSADQRETLQTIGGRIVVVSGGPTPGALEDPDGTYEAWFAEHACRAALVRPDWYVFGTAGSGGELAALVDRLARSLRAGPANRGTPADGATASATTARNGGTNDARQDCA